MLQSRFISLTILVIIFTFSMTSCLIKEETHYISDMDMYMKMIWVPSDEQGIVLFGENESLSFSDSIDYIKVYKNVSTFFLFDPDEKRKIYVLYETIQQLDSTNRLVDVSFPNVSKINSYNYQIIEAVLGDTIFYKKRDRTNPHSHVPKHPYIEICIAPHFQYVVITKDSVFSRLTPCLP